MSIINDALKKVQSKIEKNALSAWTQPSPTPPPVLGRDQEHILTSPRIPKSLFNSDTVVSSFGKKTPTILKPSKEFDSKIPKPTAPTIATSAFSISSQRKFQHIMIGVGLLICGTLIFLIGFLLYTVNLNRPGNLTSAQKTHTTSNQIVIQGIMTKDEKNMALINDKIYEEGQTVMGKEIVSISLDSVQIKDRGKIKTLKVQE